MRVQHCWLARRSPGCLGRQCRDEPCGQAQSATSNSARAPLSGYVSVLVAVPALVISGCSSTRPEEVALTDCEVFVSANHGLVASLQQVVDDQDRWIEADGSWLAWVIGGRPDWDTAYGAYVEEIEAGLPPLPASQAALFAARPGLERSLEAFMGAGESWFTSECEGSLMEGRSLPPMSEPPLSDLMTGS